MAGSELTCDQEPSPEGLLGHDAGRQVAIHTLCLGTSSVLAIVMGATLVNCISCTLFIRNHINDLIYSNNFLKLWFVFLSPIGLILPPYR